jgi:cytochrome c oxidase subunit 2
MIGRVIAMEPGDYKEWLNGNELGDLPPSEAGRHLFTSLGCITCHGLQAPSMAGLFGRQQEVILQNGRAELVTVDEAYLRESITNSTAKIVKGYEPIMPSYQPPNAITEEQISSLVAYIRSLKDAKRGPGGDEVPQTQPAVEGPGGLPGPQPGIRPGIGPGANRTPQN